MAVCVSGQIGRFQPHHLLKGLVEPNPSIYFYFFYNLQLHDQLKGERTSKMQGTLQEDLSKAVIYSTDPNIFFNTTKFSWMKNYEVSDHVTKLMNTNNSKVVSVNYGYALNVSYWRKVMNGSLDRMQFYGTEDLQARILNMYQFQPKCIDQMLAIEQYQNVTFKSIVYSREDIYTFTVVNLTQLVSLLRNGGANGTCDSISKSCLHHGGINMRFYVLTRNAGISFLGQRISFYRHLKENNLFIFNPERFEKSMSNWLNLSHCPVPFDMLPVTAARHVQNDKFCFIDYEVENMKYEFTKCYTPPYESFVQEHLCKNIMKA